MDILTTLKNRYSTKEFDPNRPLTEVELGQLEQLLQLPASSTNLQPWHFVIATTPEGKARMARGTAGVYADNAPKVLDAGVTVLFAHRVALDDAYLLHILEQEDRDGRFLSQEFKEDAHASRIMFTNYHKLTVGDFKHWSEKQVFLNLGNFLLGVAGLGLDAIAIEGVDGAILNREFGLDAMGYATSFVVAVGHRKENEFNQTLPKSRLPITEIIQRV